MVAAVQLVVACRVCLREQCSRCDLVRVCVHPSEGHCIFACAPRPRARSFLAQHEFLEDASHRTAALSGELASMQASYERIAQHTARMATFYRH